MRVESGASSGPFPILVTEPETFRYRSLALVAFLSFLAWRFSFRLLDAVFLLLRPPLSFFAMGVSSGIACDVGHASLCHIGMTWPHRPRRRRLAGVKAGRAATGRYGDEMRRGHRIQPGGKTLDRHGIGRACAHLGCETILSRYNSDPTCYLHTSYSRPRRRGPK